MTIRSREAEEIRQIALDFRKGLIYTDRHLAASHPIEDAFPILSILTQEQRDELVQAEPGLLYEYVAKAVRRSAFGHPVFLSCQYLNAPDADKVFGLIKQLEQAEKTALATAST